MKRIYIVVEGQTEQEFVNSMIAPYLQGFGIYSVTPILIRTSRIGRGGMVNYQHLYNTVQMLLKSSQTDFVVTTFIDFFRIPTNMPKYEECVQLADKEQQIRAMEKAIDESVDDRRFFSYIQKHEFEALLFSSNKGFEYYYPSEFSEKTATIIACFDNPENINSSPKGAPSKRLLSIKSDYNKVLEGNLIVMEIGINAIIDKCSRFAAWINYMVKKCKE